MAVTLPIWDGASRVRTPTEKKRDKAEAKAHWNSLSKGEQSARMNASYDLHCKAQYKKDPNSLSRQLLSSRPGLIAEYEDWKERNGILSPQQMMQVHGRNRAAALKLRTPKLITELDKFVWRELCSLRVDREHATGIRWAIDHMIPLQGRRASGLHTPSNWQLIPFWMNNDKLNRMVLTNHDEWIEFMCREWLPLSLFKSASRLSPNYDPYSVDY